MATETPTEGHLRRLRAIQNPSHKVRAYTTSIDHLVRINAEDMLATGWRERWESVNAVISRRWAALSDTEQAIVRKADQE